MVDIAELASLGMMIGERARAEMLVALMSGQAQTASELALAAGVTKQTASSHLSKLVEAGLIDVAVQGRHHYFHIADRRVARLIEQMVGVAARGAPRQFGPRDEAMRKARVCYDHLAGELGVHLYDSLTSRELLAVGQRGIGLSDRGVDALAKLGIDVAAADVGRRPMCRACLDWSVRRYHLAGAAGSLLLDRFVELGWVRRTPRSRTLHFSATGERAFRRAFPVL